SELIELRKRYDELLNAGKIVETRLLDKISHLSKIQANAKKRYDLMAKAYADAEAKNLLTIDALKEGIKKAVNTNKSLLKFADKFRKAKIAEDAADAKLEAATLLKMDGLQSELDKTTAQNRLLLSSIKEIGENLDAAKKNETKSEEKYQKIIKQLSGEIEKLKIQYEKLSKWKYETGYLPQEKVSNMFKNEYQKKKKEVKREKWKMVEHQDYGRMLPQQTRTGFDKNLPNEMRGWNSQSQQWYRQDFTSPQGLSYWQYQGYAPGFFPQSYPVNSRANANMNYGYAQNGGDYVNGLYPRSTETLYSGRTPHSRGIVDHLSAAQKVETKEDQLVAFAVDSILKAVQKMTNYDINKTNAAMNLIGAGYDLPSKLSSVLEVIREQFDSKILNKALERISEKYSHRKNFVDESLRHMYGAEGNKLPNWSAELR
ncbi:MAG: hypothetical protein IJ599_02135, partial [Alphaproteobacteria bacterium]|nr:hypothetical protein [Alphaproteobacteria bacterium]